MKGLTRRGLFGALALAPHTLALIPSAAESAPGRLASTAAAARVAEPPESAAHARLEAAPWPEAEALFHRDPRWLGGDSVYSIDLGNGRVLWLLGDSFIATSPAHRRSESWMVHNCIAVQSGYDPASASIRFYWRPGRPHPQPFFIDPEPEQWLWPLHGARVGGRLVLFFMENRRVTGGLGFEETGWRAVLVENPDASPEEWRIRLLRHANWRSLVIGSSVITDSGHLYAYAHSRDAEHRIYLVRYSASDAARGNLGTPEWYVGGGSWAPESSLKGDPGVVMTHGQTEFNVCPAAPHAPWLAVQTDGFGAAGIAYRTAPSPLGDWSDMRPFYRPPEADRRDIMIYSAKVHPMLTNSGRDLVVSYSTNCSSFGDLVRDTSLYYPRFLRVGWSG